LPSFHFSHTQRRVCTPSQRGLRTPVQGEFRSSQQASSIAPRFLVCHGRLSLSFPGFCGPGRGGCGVSHSAEFFLGSARARVRAGVRSARAERQPRLTANFELVTRDDADASRTARYSRERVVPFRIPDPRPAMTRRKDRNGPEFRWVRTLAQGKSSGPYAPAIPPRQPKCHRRPTRCHPRRRRPGTTTTIAMTFCGSSSSRSRSRSRALHRRCLPHPVPWRRHCT
jgi:hypothetical protein